MKIKTWFATKVEQVSPQITSWDTKGDKPHSVARIDWVGVNTKGWVVLRLHPRSEEFGDKCSMIDLIESLHIDMKNANEEGTIKMFNYSKETDGSVQIETQDLDNFLRQLKASWCITETDLKVISADIKRQKGCASTSSTSSATLPLLSAKY